MRNILLRVAYDGTDFHGWQRQPRGRTVQNVLEQALAVLHGYPVGLYAAGRTDTGVHARGQIAHFHSDNDSIPAVRFRDALNAHLPADVRVLQSHQADDQFHARYDAYCREYRYYLATAAVLAPPWHRYYLHLRRPLDVTKMNRVASRLIGLHDFATFTVAGGDTAVTTRTVFAAGFIPWRDAIVFRIVANGFLRRMVRSIIGTILDLARDHTTAHQAADRFAALLDAGQRACAGTSAPAHALVLHRVGYREAGAVVRGAK